MTELKQSKGMVHRALVLGLVFFIIFGFLILQLFRIQIVNGKELATTAFAQRAQKLPLEMQRGDILDRHLQSFTNRTKMLSCGVFPIVIPPQQREAIAGKLAEFLPLKQEEILQSLKDPLSPHILYEPLKGDIAQKIAQLNLAGVVVMEKRMRYEIPGLAHHVIGYVKRSNDQGVAGIEKSFNPILKNQERENIVAIVDARRGLINGLGVRLQPTAKENERHVVLTIDKTIQQHVEETMDRYMTSGAVVVLKPQTGEILAMASRPDFYPWQLESHLNHEKEDKGQLVNRCVRSFPPGSIFKIVVGAAALEEKVAEPEETFTCPGYIEIGDHRVRCHAYEANGHGKISFYDGMVHSCNVVFIELANRLGKDKILNYARKFGFGESTGIDLNEENTAILPDPQKMYPGDLANMAIGQGELEASPLQAAQMIGIIANDGVKVPLMLAKEVRDGNGELVEKFPKLQSMRVIAPDTAYALQKMLVDVTRKGTGQAAQVKGIVVAGKTGTAQTGHADEEGDDVTHAWFAGYAPADHPQYVVVVFDENGGAGGKAAAPVFSEIVERLLKLNQDQ